MNNGAATISNYECSTEKKGDNNSMCYVTLVMPAFIGRVTKREEISPFNKLVAWQAKRLSNNKGKRLKPIGVPFTNIELRWIRENAPPKVPLYHVEFVQWVNGNNKTR